MTRVGSQRHKKKSGF